MRAAPQMLRASRFLVILLDCTRWPQFTDELYTAVEKAADMCHADENTCIICLYPVIYKGLASETCLKRVRGLEDRFMENKLTMGNKFSLHYNVPEEHGNEKRTLGQEGRLLLSKTATSNGEHSPWLETMVARGRFPHDVELVRVRDMVLPGRTPADRDRRLGPSERIAQKGVDAARRMLKGFLANLTLKPGAKTIFANLMPGAIDEWGAGAWKLAKEDQMDVAYVALVTDVETHKEIKAELAKTLMEEWWNNCPEAGPLEPAAPVEIPAPRLKIVSWSSGVPVLCESILDKFEPGTPQFAEIQSAIKSFWEEFGYYTSASPVLTSTRTAATSMSGPDYSENPPAEIGLAALPKHMESASDLSNLADAEW